MKKYFALFATAFILAGCQSQSVFTSTPTPDAQPTVRVGDTTLSGKLTQSGDKFVLLDSTGKQTEVDSYKIEFTDLVNKDVTVTGQFSGDTLFVSKLEEK